MHFLTSPGLLFIKPHRKSLLQVQCWGSDFSQQTFYLLFTQGRIGVTETLCIILTFRQSVSCLLIFSGCEAIAHLTCVVPVVLSTEIKACQWKNLYSSQVFQPTANHLLGDKPRHVPSRCIVNKISHEVISVQFWPKWKSFLSQKAIHNVDDDNFRQNLNVFTLL